VSTEKNGQASHPGLEIRHRADVVAEEKGSDDPGADYQERPSAGPAGLRALGRRVADEQPNRKTEEGRGDDPAAEAKEDADGPVPRPRRRDHDERGRSTEYSIAP
jgi:hypothetical protein